MTMSNAWAALRDCLEHDAMVETMYGAETWKRSPKVCRTDCMDGTQHLINRELYMETPKILGQSDGGEPNLQVNVSEVKKCIMRELVI